MQSLVSFEASIFFYFFFFFNGWKVALPASCTGKRISPRRHDLAPKRDVTKKEREKEKNLLSMEIAWPRELKISLRVLTKQFEEVWKISILFQQLMLDRIRGRGWGTRVQT